MTLTAPRPRIHSRVGKTTITLFGIALIGWLLPHSVWNRIQPTARAAGFTVNGLADTPDAAPGNGTCADAGGTCTLRAAIQEVNAFSGNDTINFSVMGTINLASALPNLSSNITISGPGSALLTVRRDTGGDYRIFTAQGTVAISGLTVTNGKTADGVSGDGGDGGGINNFGSLTLFDVIVTGNTTGRGASGPSFATSGGNGGGLYNSGTLTLTDVIVTTNSTGVGGNGVSQGSRGGHGAGVYNSGTLTMTNSSVNGNTTGRGGDGNNGPGNGGDGGGLFNSNTFAMTGGVVTGNTTGKAGDSVGLGATGGRGGGIYTEAGLFTLTGVNVSNNTAGNGGGNGGFGGHGGGIYISNGAGTLTNCNVSGNTAGLITAPSGTNGYAGAIENGGVLTITGSTLSSNTGNAAGAILNRVSLTMANSTVSGNTTLGSGAAIDNSNTSATMSLTNCTIAGNNAAGISSNTQTPPMVRNTIIGGNSSGGNGPDALGTFNSQGHNLIGNGDGSTSFGAPGDQVGTGAAPLNPGLGPLASNGGPTLTHALLSGSPALDAGSNSLAKDANNNTLTTDQRGVARIEDSPDAGTTATVDIGAFEFQPSLENVSDKTTNEDTQVLFSFAVGDAGTVTSVTASSDNPALIPDANLSLTGAGGVRTLRITPVANLSGTAQVTLTVNYAGGSVLTDTFLLTVTPVNDAPSFTKGPDQTINEDASAQTITNWATGISAGPLESSQTLTFLVTNNTNAGLFSAGPSISDSGTLTYTPAPNAFGTALVTLVITDNGGTANGGQDTSAAQTFTINITAINDAPTFTKGADQTVNEDSGFQQVQNWATGINGGPNEQQQVVTFLVTGNTNTSLFSLAPSVNVLGTLNYQPAPNASGSATITVVAQDEGGTANGGTDTSPAQTFNINVTAVNDPPFNSVPFSQITNQNTPRVFSSATFNAISVSDLDAATDPVRITLTATQGTLTLGSTAGITFVTGDGTDDVTMTFTGTISAINTSLNGLTFKPNTNFSGAASIQIVTDDQGFNGSGGAKTDADTVAINVRPPSFQLGRSSYSINEAGGHLTITVTRAGDLSQAISVDYATSDPSGLNACSQVTVDASQRCDYATVVGTLRFAAGQTAKPIHISIVDDAYVEVAETFTLTLSNNVGGALGTPATATITINDNDVGPAANPLDNDAFWIRQLYIDILGREPEPGAVDAWMAILDDCPTNPTSCDREEVALGFLRSEEFQTRGFFVYRFYAASLGRPPVYTEFVPDHARVSGFLSVSELELNKQAYLADFMNRTEFRNVYDPTLGNSTAYVDTLMQRAGLASHPLRTDWIDGLNGGTLTRAQVLREFVDSVEVYGKFVNDAFVVMNYFGLLRRTADGQYPVWIEILNTHGHRAVTGGFIRSQEYRQRFGP